MGDGCDIFLGRDASASLFFPLCWGQLLRKTQQYVLKLPHIIHLVSLSLSVPIPFLSFTLLLADAPSINYYYFCCCSYMVSVLMFTKYYIFSIYRYIQKIYNGKNWFQSLFAMPSSSLPGRTRKINFCPICLLAGCPRKISGFTRAHLWHGSTTLHTLSIKMKNEIYSLP